MNNENEEGGGRWNQTESRARLYIAKLILIGF